MTFDLLSLTDRAEARQRQELRRFRLVATGLLVAMAAVFLATRLVPDPGFWVLLIRAGAEAAMVGGLADWFAVTALFRHPFGIPIPHTALIPRNKDRLGAGLGSFVERHFLEPDEVTRKLRELDLATRFSQWLADPVHADALARRLVAGVPYVMRSIEDREVRSFLETALHDQLRSFDLAPFLGRAIEVLVDSDHHHALFDRAIELAARLLAENEARIYEMVAEKSAWWMPPAVDRRIAEVIVTAIYELLVKLRNPDHEARQRLNESVRKLIDNLQTSPRYKARIAQIKEQVLASPAVRAYMSVVWDEVKVLVQEDAAHPDSRLRRALAGGIVAMAQALLADASMRERVNRRIEAFVITFVVPWRSEIGTFIAEVVRRWDPHTVADRVELEVGRDLQYIRVNGTVVGALVGCLLFLFSHLLFP